MTGFMTVYGETIPADMLTNRLEKLTNQFYKILPLRENGVETLPEYMKSLMAEMLGAKDLIDALRNDAIYLTLLSILSYLISYDCDVDTVRREVFKALSLIKKITDKYKSGYYEGEADYGRVGDI